MDYWEDLHNRACQEFQAIATLEDKYESDLLKQIGIELDPPAKHNDPFGISFQSIERWDTFFYRTDFVKLESDLKGLGAARLGDIAHFANRPWKPEDFPTGDFRYIEISSVTKSEGIIKTRIVSTATAPSRATTLVTTGDMLIATTRPYLGAFVIVPAEYDGTVCSSGFSVIDDVDEKVIIKEYLLAFLKSAAGLRQMERRMTGGLYPAIIQSELENIRIPLLSLPDQKALIEKHKEVEIEMDNRREEAKKLLRLGKTDVQAMILGDKSVRIEK